MGFRRRLWISYLAILLAVALIGSAAFVALQTHRYMAEEFATMDTLAQQVVARMDLQIAVMQAAIDSMLSDRELLNDMQYLTLNGVPGPRRTETLSQFNVKLNQWFYSKSFYRVLYYNRLGDVVASYNYSDHRIDPDMSPDRLEWLDRADGRKGKVYLVAPRQDEWGLRENPRVFSLVKEIQGRGMGYIEVQMPSDALTDALENIGENRQVFVYYEDDVAFYLPPGEADAWMGAWEDFGLTTAIRTNPVTGKREIVAITPQSENGIRVAIAVDSAVIWQQMGPFVLLVLACVAGLMGVFFVYVSVVSRRLSQPVVNLRRQIEQMDPLGGSLHLSDETDEMGAFSEAFTQMVDTINDLLLDEWAAEIQLQRARARQREMQLLYLRSQINPHFLYNTLDTIRFKAVMHEDDSVVDMIQCLITFFRNGVDHSTQIVSLGNEIETVRAYLRIMVYRYPNVTVRFDLDEGLMDTDVPNFILQPLVENSFTHGLKEALYRGEIRIATSGLEDGRVCIRIENDGAPISPEQLAHIEACAHDWSEEGDVRPEKRHIGLNNISRRLRMYYPEPGCGLFFRAAQGGGLAVDVVIARHIVDEGGDVHAL